MLKEGIGYIYVSLSKMTFQNAHDLQPPHNIINIFKFICGIYETYKITFIVCYNSENTLVVFIFRHLWHVVHDLETFVYYWCDMNKRC